MNFILWPSYCLHTSPLSHFYLPAGVFIKFHIKVFKTRLNELLKVLSGLSGWRSHRYRFCISRHRAAKSKVGLFVSSNSLFIGPLSEVRDSVNIPVSLSIDNVIQGVYGYDTKVFLHIIPYKFHKFISTLFSSSTRKNWKKNLCFYRGKSPGGIFWMEETQMSFFLPALPGASNNYNINGHHIPHITRPTF